MVKGALRPITNRDIDRFPEFRPVLDAWSSADRESLADLKAGPLRAYADNVCVLEAVENGEFRYLHYGKNVGIESGISMAGKTTAGFGSGVGSALRDGYQRALDDNAVLYSVNGSQSSHLTHSWQRFILPLHGHGERPNRVIALVRSLLRVDEVLSAVGISAGFVGGTLEPIVEGEQILDFALLPLTPMQEMLGQNEPSTLSTLLGQQLSADDIKSIASAYCEEQVFSKELVSSEERFGRVLVARVMGARNQPIFSLFDATELVLARRYAEEQRQAMKDFAEVGSDWMWETDADHRMNWMTQGVQRATGNPISFFLGRSRMEYAQSGANNHVFARHVEDLKAQRPFRDFIFSLPGTDGEIRWICVNGVPLFDEDGTFQGYRGTGSNITAEIEAKRALEAQRAAFEDFANAASDWMWTSDENHVMTWMSDTAERATGNPLSYFLGRSRIDMVRSHTDDAAFSAHVKDLNAQRPFRDFIYKMKGADNQGRWIRVNGVPRFDEDGTFLGYRGTGANITEEIEAKRALEEQRAAFEAYANTASDWMWETDENHCMTWVSGAINRATGFPNSTYIGKNRAEFSNLPENAEILRAHKEDLAARRPFRDLIYKTKAIDGSDRWLRINGVPRFDNDGTFVGYRGTGSNITEEVEARARADRRGQDLAEAHKLGRMGAWRFDRRSRRFDLSEEFLALVNVKHQNGSANLKDLLKYVSGETLGDLSRAYRSIIRTGDASKTDLTWLHSSSENMALTVYARPEYDEIGNIVGIFGIVQDVTSLKKAERQLEKLAYFDPLTGLGNRAYFTRELSTRFNALAVTNHHSGETGQKVHGGLMLLDLDHFKEVNDTLGHAAGDQLLRRVAERLRRCVGPDPVVCRLGGDEFAIIVPKVESEDEISALAAKISDAFSGTVSLNEGAVHIATSIGLVMFPRQTGDPEEAMRFADLALYRAKEEGRSRWQFFETEFDDEVRDRVSLGRDLRRAVSEGDLDAHFQLQVDLKNGRVSGFEALARWTHPTRGPIPPSRFIPIAESSHLIADIGDWILNEVCRQGREWLDAGGAPLEMSVNLSVAQLWYRDIESDIVAALAKHDFPAHLLCIELTESVFEDEAMLRIEYLLRRLKDLGVRLALDDFGTGYSSMQYLNKLSFDKLKIDRSFVRGCDTSADQRRLLQGMVGLGKGLGMQVVVEGVENEDELKVVLDLGCEGVQGFYFARPMPFHDAALTAAQVETDHTLTRISCSKGKMQPVGNVVTNSASFQDFDHDVLKKRSA